MSSDLRGTVFGIPLTGGMLLRVRKRVSLGRPMGFKSLSSLGVVALWSLVSACAAGAGVDGGAVADGGSDAGTQTTDAGSPDTLTLTGRVCTAPPDSRGFPTKVVLLIDQSASMCITDPPGSQAFTGFCEMHGFVPAGVTVPARVRAIQALLDQAGASPLEIALVPFSTNVRGAWPTPSASNSSVFQEGDANLRSRLSTLAPELGEARSDFQGALAYAQALIIRDVDFLQSSFPETLPHTRYIVLLLADGPPSPRCSAVDTSTTYADDAHPELVWHDSEAYCNTATSDDPAGITGFTAGEARNQNSQLFAFVDRLRALKAEKQVGEVRVDTVLLSNPEALARCGTACDDLFGQKLRWPGPTQVPGAQNPVFARGEATWLMRELAARGGGTFTEFVDFAGVGALTLAALNSGWGVPPTVLKKFLVQPLRATPYQGAWLLDSDGDGAPDELEALNRTHVLASDSDGDGFDDWFEINNTDAGFDPLVKDARGCDPTSPLTPGCAARDLDRDGLSQYAEAWLTTNQLFVDTDRDGFPDGFEVRAGLSPTQRLEAMTDTDADGVPDADELARGSDPRRADLLFSERLGITTSLEEQLNADGSACYTFRASNLPMLSASASVDAGSSAGANLFQLWFAGAPRGIPSDTGEWQTACAWAWRAGNVFEPSSRTLDLQAELFKRPWVLDPRAGPCAGRVPP
jgi:hypothetical protein